jgi:phosphatidylglycerophosphatase A
MKIKKNPPPPWAFLFRSPHHFFACGLGSGLSPWASGTAGTLFAWLVYPLLRQPLPGDLPFALFLAAALAYGVLACDRTGRALGVADHGAIVWDEIVPFWCVLFLAPAGLLWQCAAFFLFRFFDIIKPPPARWFDLKMKNGFGVMMDDVVAAAYTLLALQAARLALPGLGSGG